MSRRVAEVIRATGGHINVTQLHLAIALLSHFAKWGFGTDADAVKELLNEVISLYYDALRYYNTGHARRGQLLGNHKDLDQAIALQKKVLDLHPDSHTDRSIGLFSRFENRGNDEDLDEAIALHREALALRPVSHTDRSMSLHNLVIELSSRFDHRGNNEDLDEAIALQSEALAMHPIGHTDQHKSLNNLANQLFFCFRHQGHDEDLDQSIAFHREALALLLVGHTDRSASLNNLAAQLSSRFHHRGNNEDLDEAIALQREALVLLLVNHTGRSMSLNNLVAQLSSRFNHRGNGKDLNEAIALQREALALHPRSTSLHNLVNHLSSRFLRQGHDKDLDEAITLQREALALCPVGHPDRSGSLNDFAIQLSSRFNHRGNGEDLDEAIALQREVLALRLVGYTDWSTSLHNLAIQLSSRFNHRSNGEDLDEAIALQREALALLPVGHTGRSMSLNNLVNQLFSHFALRGNDEDLDEAIEFQREALALCPVGLDGTGAGKNTASLNAAMHHLETAANIVSGGLLSCLHASLRWVRHASRHSHGTQLEAYGTSMQLLDVYMSVTASVSSRHNAMKKFPSTLAVDVTSCSLHSGNVHCAVELLEQGRTIIWAQMARLRTPLDSLETCGDHAVTLMKRFRDLSSLLDKPPASHPEGTQRVDVEAEETRYRRRVEDWNGTVEEIWKIEGFSRFLLPPLFSYLQNAGRDGPIIMLIASRSSCNAIIIPHEQSPTSIQLPTNLQKLTKLVLAFRKAVPKDAGPKGNQQALMEALRELWDVVVRPVVENLAGIARRGPRIWWCPTSAFNFLPLHAAGEYRKGGQSLLQHYISSYTPSLTAITSNDATKATALNALRDNTWLHLACHGTQRFDEPFESAFLMRDQPLSLLDITQMDLSRHQFAFLSACETAVVIHLAAGLQFAGVKSIVGTLWKVDDSTVQRLVKAFYENLCGDGTMNSKRAAWALHQASSHWLVTRK
ncbi:CHAT domain-containing protein [Suillus tomentosus]|nr:CHAT domain-containing protein [Suillus tomentosus]